MASLTVPTLDGPQIKSTAFGGQQNIQTNVDQFGGADARLAGQAAQSLEKVSQVTQNIFLAEQKKSDDISLLNYEAQLDKWEAENVRPFYSKKGISTQGGSQDLVDKFDEIDKRLVGGLPDRIQSRATNNALARRRRIGGNATRHESQQMSAHLNEMHVNRIDNNITNAINSYTDEKSVAQARANIVGSLTARNKSEGWSPDKYNNELKKSLSAIHKGTVERMISEGRALDAKEYLHNAKEEDELTANDIQSLNKVVKGENLRIETQEAAADIWERSGGNIQVANKMARDELSGEIEDATIVRLQRMERNSKEGDSDFAMRWVDKNSAPELTDKYKLIEKAKLITDARKRDLVIARIRADIALQENANANRVLTQSAGIAEGIRSTLDEDGNPLNIEQQVDAAGELGPQMQKEVIRILKEKEGLRLQAIKTSQAQAYQEAVKYQSWDQVPATLRAKLSGSQIKALKTQTIPFDAKLNQKFFDMLAAHETGSNDFINYKFENDAGKLPNNIIAQWQKLQATYKITNPANKRDQKIISNSIKRVTMITNGTMADALIGSKKIKARADAQINQVKLYMLGWTEDFLKNNREMKPDEFNKRVDQEIYRAMIEGTVYADEMFFFNDRSDANVTFAKARNNPAAHKDFRVNLDDETQHNEIARGFGITVSQVQEMTKYLNGKGYPPTMKIIETFLNSQR